MISISSYPAEWHGPLYFRGQSEDFLPKTGRGTVAHNANGYTLNNYSIASQMPTQLLGFGIYCYRKRPGREVWLTDDPTVLTADQQFLKDHGFPCIVMEPRTLLIATIKYTEILKKKYRAIHDKGSGLICVYDPSFLAV